MFVALKNSTKTPSIYLLMCNLNKEKFLIFLFSLSHSHCVSFYFFTCTAPPRAKSSHFCFSHNGRMALLLQLSTQCRMASVFFPFFFSVSACLTPLRHCPRNGILTLEALHHSSLREVRPTHACSALH